MKTKIFLITLIPIIIILLSFRFVVFDESFYKNEFKIYNIYDKVENADSLLNNLLNYYKNKEKLNNFNDKEQLHLKDVKSLIKNTFILLYSLVIIAIMLIATQIKKDKHELKKILLYSGIISISLTLILIILSLIDFSDLFTKFHLIFFRNNLWLLNPIEDKLIQLFPEQIFKDVIRKIFIYSLFLSITLIISSFFIKNGKRISKTGKDNDAFV